VADSNASQVKWKEKNGSFAVVPTITVCTLLQESIYACALSASIKKTQYLHSDMPTEYSQLCRGYSVALLLVILKNTPDDIVGWQNICSSSCQTVAFTYCKNQSFVLATKALRKMSLPDLDPPLSSVMFFLRQFQYGHLTVSRSLASHSDDMSY